MSQVPVAGGSCGGHSSGAHWWCLGGLWREMVGVCEAWGTLVHLWVMHSMAIDETQHVFPGGGVGDLFPVC